MEEALCKLSCLSLLTLSDFLLTIQCFFVDQDRFSEILFHVSSITNVKKLDKGRFSVYFKKKRYDFLAHNDGKKTHFVQFLKLNKPQ